MGSESATIRLAFRIPLADAVNTTLIVQLAPPAKVAPQVLVCKKSLAFAPVTVMAVMARAVVPRLRSVISFAALGLPTRRSPKSMELGDNDTAVPVPLSPTL